MTGMFFLVVAWLLSGICIAWLIGGTSCDELNVSAAGTPRFGRPVPQRGDNSRDNADLARTLAAAKPDSVRFGELQQRIAAARQSCCNEFDDNDRSGTARLSVLPRPRPGAR